MKLFLATIAATLLSANAHAVQEQSSEIFHQAGAGSFEFSPALDYARLKATYKNNVLGLKSTTVTGPHIEGKFEYGINSMLAVGGILGYASTNSEVSPSGIIKDTTSKGMVDPDIFLNGAIAAGPGSFRFGTHFTYSIDKSKTEANGDTNQASGGMALIPFIGYEMPVGPHIFGGRLSYELIKGDRKSTDSSGGTDVNSTTSGGEDLSAAFFYEFAMPAVSLGTSLEVIASKETSTETAGISTDNHDSTTRAQLNFYAPFRAAPNFTLIPRVSYQRYTAYNSALVDYFDGFLVHVGARFAF